VKVHKSWTEKLDELTLKQQFSNGKHFSTIAVTPKLAIDTGGVKFGSQVWWKEPAAYQCNEKPGTQLPGDWGSCAQAAAVNACVDTEFSIKEICCKTCCDKHGDASDMQMALAFGKGATCKGVGEAGYCTKNHEVKRMCCKSCASHIAAANKAVVKMSDKVKKNPKGVSTGRGIFANKKAMINAALGHHLLHGDNKNLKAPPSTKGTVWWKLPSAFKCYERFDTTVPKWGTCADAVKQGGCTSTEFSIRTICCKSCCVRDMSDRHMQKMFSGDTHASCKAAAAAGLCKKDHNIKIMCCKTCQALQ
jgi:hypothetical protein